jgi:hypothetical protein
MAAIGQKQTGRAGESKRIAITGVTAFLFRRRIEDDPLLTDSDNVNSGVGPEEDQLYLHFLTPVALRRR